MSNIERTAETLGENIRMFRQEKEMTIAELSDKCAMSPSWISNIETGKRTPSLPVFVKIANGLDVATDDLLVEYAL